MNILLLHNHKGVSTTTNKNLFKALSDFLDERHTCRVFANSVVPWRFFLTYYIRARNFFWADVIICHTNALFSFDLLILSKLFKKKTIIFAWDEYPVSLKGDLGVISLSQRIRDRIETKAVHLASVIVVPTNDFCFASEPGVHVLPLWASAPESQKRKPMNPVKLPSVDLLVTKIAFAGNINLFRGLDLCLKKLSETTVNSLELHVFSSGMLDVSVASNYKNITIVNHGFLSKDKLQLRLQEMHFGLLSLHPHFKSAAFPSKIFDYADCGLPVLYFGPNLVHFIDLIESSGIGVSLINSLEKVDFLEMHQELMAGYDKALIQFRLATNLSWSRFDQVL